MDYVILPGDDFTFAFPVFALATRKPGQPSKAVFDPTAPANITPYRSPKQGAFFLVFTDADQAETAAAEMGRQGIPGKYPVRIDSPADLCELLEFFQAHGVQYVGVDLGFREHERKGLLRPIGQVMTACNRS